MDEAKWEGFDLKPVPKQDQWADFDLKPAPLTDEPAGFTFGPDGEPHAEHPLPRPFLDRIAEGHAAIEDAKKRGVLDKLLGLTGERYQLWPERMIRSGVTLPRDVMTGEVLTGPGLRREDFTDIPGDAQPVDELIHRAGDMAAFQLAQTAIPKISRELLGRSPLVRATDGTFARLTSSADGQGKAELIGPAARDADFKNASSVLAEEAKRPVVEERLRQTWREEGVHPAEAEAAAEKDAFIHHDLTTPAKKVETPKDLLENSPVPLPKDAGHAVDSLPPPVSPAVQPLQPPGGLVGALKTSTDFFLDAGRELQMMLTPMARGTQHTLVPAKDFANTLRRNRWEWSRIDDDIVKRFTPEQRTKLWEAMDEESVMRQAGNIEEGKGLDRLTPDERSLVEGLHTRSQIAWAHARELGMVEGEGLPYYVPRMVANVATATSKDALLPLDGIGTNLRTRTAQMLRRKYQTAEETEAAAKAKYGPAAVLTRDIRVLPMATAHLEDAIAGRVLVENIKKIGRQAGDETVSVGFVPEGSEHAWFTIDHPALKTWRPKFKVEVETGAALAMKDAEGNTLFEQVPIYVRGDFEGPLRAVLSKPDGKIYSAFMELKGKTMSVIMNSPLIHNAVIWGKALPAAPGQVFSMAVYFKGNRAKNNPELMREAIDHGLVPIGKRFFRQDTSSVIEAPDLTAGRSWTSKILSAVPGLFDPAAGVAVKRAIDRAGDFWHNTMLWDRIADLQMGMYEMFVSKWTSKGVDRNTASYMAAHFANRFAGSLPQEAMSSAARKSANFFLFSRTFTLGNLGLFKDALTGLPKDVIAQIERDGGTFDPKAAGYAKSLARRKAMSAILLDIGMFYIGTEILQTGINVMLNDTTLEQELREQALAVKEKLEQVKEHPLELLQPFDLAHNILSPATAANEPGRQDRLFIGYDKDGTAIYARNPAGKIGEEFVGYLSSPLDMVRRKMGTIARPAWQVFANDKGFGRKIYDPEADTPAKYLLNLGRVAKHLAMAQTPEHQINAFADLVKGEGDPKVNALQALGPVAGFTFSKGAPGGPPVGEMYSARAKHQFSVDMAMPDIRRQIQRGDVEGAVEAMTELNIPPALQRFYIKTTENPALRLSPRALRDFYRYSTDEQKARMDRAREKNP